MKKTLLSALLSLSCLAIGTINATEAFIEAKAGLYEATSHRYKEIFNQGGIYGADLDVQLYENLHGWIGGSYFEKHGHTEALHSKTKIDLIPITLGLKYYLNPCWFDGALDLYAGLGAQYTRIHLVNESPYVPHDTHKWEFGGVANVGALYHLNESWFLDLFANYSYLKMDYHNTANDTVTPHNVNLSGWTFGLGIGYKFCLGG